MNRIDARRVAADSRELSGTTTVSDWPRATELVVDPSATIEWQVTGGHDDHGRPRLQLELRGYVEVTCQRCLQPMRLALGSGASDELAEERRITSVLLAANEHELVAWDEEVEEAEVVLAREPIDLDELLEDEFLLSLPFSPMCDDPMCPKRAGIDTPEETGESDGPSTEESNPFAILRERLGPKNH